MSALKGFWSYSHADNDAENGRITRLRDDVIAEFGLITGEEISVFLDSDQIQLGDNWREKIDENLSNVGFFVAILTPRYLKSLECRREFQAFVDEATKLGYQDLILSILYIDNPDMRDDSNTDELIRLARTYQWKDWTELRLSDRESENYRRGIADIAKRLSEANKRLEERSEVLTIQANAVEAQISAEEDGVIDQLASAEAEMLEVPGTLNKVTEQMLLFAEFGNQATEEMNRGASQGKGFAAKLISARKLANQLKGPAEIIFELSNTYSAQINKVDKGYRLILERAPIEVAADPTTKENFCSFFKAAQGMIVASTEAFVKIRSLIETLDQFVKLSKDLRPVVRRIQEGLTIMISSEVFFNQWTKLMDEADIDCNELELVS